MSPKLGLLLIVVSFLLVIILAILGKNHGECIEPPSNMVYVNVRGVEKCFEITPGVWKCIKPTGERRTILTT